MRYWPLILLLVLLIAATSVTPVVGYKDFKLGAKWVDVKGRFEFAHGEEQDEWILLGEEQLTLDAEDVVIPMQLSVAVKGEIVRQVSLEFQTKRDQPAEVKRVFESLLGVLKKKYPQPWLRHYTSPEHDIIGWESIIEFAEDTSGNSISASFSTAWKTMVPATSTIRITYALPDEYSEAEDAL